jgi:hypothetical protein
MLTKFNVAKKLKIIWMYIIYAFDFEGCSTVWFLYYLYFCRCSSIDHKMILIVSLWRFWVTYLTFSSKWMITLFIVYTPSIASPWSEKGLKLSVVKRKCFNDLRHLNDFCKRDTMFDLSKRFIMKSYF